MGSIKKTLISIIVPIYNSEKYLCECLDSIKKQTYKELQIILVNDGSTDSSKRICEKYCKEDNRFILINKENGGVTSARNIGLKYAKGTYVGFVDSDDWIDEKMYESLYFIAQETDVDVVTSRYYSNDEAFMRDIPPEGLYILGYNKDILYKDFFLEGNKGFVSGLCDKLYKKSIICNYNSKVDVSIAFAEDAVCTYPLLLNAKSIYVLNTPFYHYRIRNDSSTKRLNSNYFKNLDKISAVLRESVMNSGYSELLMPQLSRYMKSLLAYGLSIFFGNQVSDLYLFPYEVIPSKSSVILYGAGKVGRSYYNQLVQGNYCDIVAWVDQNNSKCGDRVSSIDTIINQEYDFILISIAKKEIADEIREMLINEYKVEPKKIIWIVPKVFPNTKVFEWNF